jgi:hypothetical protein
VSLTVRNANSIDINVTSQSSTIGSLSKRSNNVRTGSQCGWGQSRKANRREISFLSSRKESRLAFVLYVRSARWRLSETTWKTSCILSCYGSSRRFSSSKFLLCSLFTASLLRLIRHHICPVMLLRKLCSSAVILQVIKSRFGTNICGKPDSTASTF